MVETKNLGENCKRCWCSVCEYRPYCGIMNGNTDWSCDNDCKGEAYSTDNCSQYEKRNQ